MVFNPSRPFGVEIEAIGLDTHEAADAMVDGGVYCSQAGYTHEVSDSWKTVTDSSLGGGRTFEAVSPIMYGDNGASQIVTVMAALKAAGVTVNKSCGLHVHHYAEDMSPMEMISLTQLYQTYESAIDTLMAPSRVEGDYCKKMQGFNYDHILALKRPVKRSVFIGVSCGCSYSNDCRFHKLNWKSLSRHGTVEFRQHQGTVNGQKAVAWVRLTQAMVEAAKTTFFLRKNTNVTLEGFFRAINLDDKMVRYWTKRAASFGNDVVEEAQPNMPEEFWFDYAYDSRHNYQTGNFRVALEDPRAQEPPNYLCPITNMRRADNRSVYRIRMDVNSGSISRVYTMSSYEDDFMFYHKTGDRRIQSGGRLPTVIERAARQLSLPTQLELHF